MGVYGADVRQEDNRYASRESEWRINMTQSERRIYLIKALLEERNEYTEGCIPGSAEKQKQLLRALMNIRKAKEISPGFLAVQDEYLKEEIEKKGIVDASLLPEIRKGITLWQGDITLLKCDAIVNAANSRMTGCYNPNHRCIDNCIHTYAGIQLRLKCAEMMIAQGIPEPAGKAKITPAYNLPSRYVIHTVGPIIMGDVTPLDEEKLASCYRACLKSAEENGVRSIAFCCISTGVFSFPQKRAAEIAVKTVEDYLGEDSSIKKVIFNVFRDEDREIYSELLSR